MFLSISVREKPALIPSWCFLSDHEEETQDSNQTLGAGPSSQLLLRSSTPLPGVIFSWKGFSAAVRLKKSLTFPVELVHFLGLDAKHKSF